MTSPSQSLNKSYGLLWWLNGQPSFMIPDLQIVFNGSMIPNAPDETWCALGKNDQKIYIIPSQRMVIIRMGNDGGQVTGAVSSFDNLLWEKINGLNCLLSVNNDQRENIKIFPNPTEGFPQIDTGNGSPIETYQIFDIKGQLLLTGVENVATAQQQFSQLSAGMYIFKVVLANGKSLYKKVVKR